MLGPDKGLQVQKRHGHTEEGPKKGHKDDEETGACVLCEKAERAGTVQDGEGSVGGTH